jgi:hypothetical protein
MLSLYGVFMLCYFYVIALCGELRVFVERSESLWTSKRKVTHISSTYFYYRISVFSSMHDRWNYSTVLQNA